MSRTPGRPTMEALQAEQIDPSFTPEDTDVVEVIRGVQKGRATVGAVRGPGGGALQTFTKTMEPQDQVYLDTTPLEILPSPGAGKFIRVLDAMAWQVPGFSVYGCSGASVDMFLGNDKDTGIMVFNHTGCFDPDNLGNDTDDYVYKAYFGTGSDGLQNGALLSAIVDKPLILQADGSSNIAIAIATYEVADGGIDYVNGDTGSFTSGDKGYDYIVTASAAGVVSAISIAEQGSFGTAIVANGVETSAEGGQPGIGTGLTLNVLTVTAPEFDVQINYSVVYTIQSI